MLEEASRTIPCLERIVVLEDLSGNEPAWPTSSKFLAYSALLSISAPAEKDWRSVRDSVIHEDILNLQFTSGSTGLPKAASLTHYGITNSARYIGTQINVAEKDTIVIPVPLFHAFGLIIGICTAVFAGAAVVLPSEYFEAAATLSAVEKYRCTGLYGVTTMFVDELSHPLFSSTNLSSLRFGIMAGSAMPEELLTRVTKGFPIPELYTNWGMTELSSIATMTTAADPVEKKMRTAGKLLPNFTGKIVEPGTGTVKPWGKRGEIVISGFGVMHSYYNNATQTAKSIKLHSEDLLPGQAGYDDQGRRRLWMHTGDEGYIDEEGYLVITGRIKDLIIRGGENIAPLEIESRLYGHPAVKQAVVFGLPSNRYGEEVAAILELADGLTERPSDGEIKNWVRATMSRYKVPVFIWWLGDKELGIPTEWPKTANGKLRKPDVKAIGKGLLESSKSRFSRELRPNL